MKNFVATKERLPEIGQLVWLYNSRNNTICLGIRELIYDGWMWAVAYDKPYVRRGKIMANCHIDDNYAFDYWAEIPELPEIEGKE
jgi:hypothetical protein